jgi:hypothetical protein
LVRRSRSIEKSWASWPWSLRGFLAPGIRIRPDQLKRGLAAHHLVAQRGERHQRILAGHGVNQSGIGQRAHQAVEKSRAFVAQDAVGAEPVEPGGDDFLRFAAGEHLDDAAAAEARLPAPSRPRRDIRATPLSALRTMISSSAVGGRASPAPARGRHRSCRKRRRPPRRNN